MKIGCWNTGFSFSLICIAGFINLQITLVEVVKNDMSIEEVT
jgi:hypothetical protein